MEYILNDPTFQETLAKLAEDKGESFHKVQKEAKGYLKELYTDHQPVSSMITLETVQYILSRTYNKNIDVNPAEIRQLSKLVQNHPIAFVMTHKTYIDMIVLGLVLAQHGLPVPYIFGGINLSFMGLAQIGRQNGIIFIRRSFKNNLVYKATLRHYIAKLIDEKGSFMWSIEGTRSRTGKLVWPQMGILKYIMEGEKDSHQDVKYVPVSIVYDLIPDVKEMTLEGRGKKKKAESLSWMLDYVNKLGDDLGKISIRFGEPVDLETDTTAPIPDMEDEEAVPEAQRTIPHVAFELVHRINQVTPVTTTSLICISLLSKYALSKRAIESDVAALMEFIESHQPDALVDRGRPISESVQTSLNLLNKAGMFLPRGNGQNARYTISTENYLQSTYYANMAVHHLYHRAFIELAVMQMADTKVENRELLFWENIMALRDLFKFEFFYSAKPQFTEEIEADLSFVDKNWRKRFFHKKTNYKALVSDRKLLIAPVVLYNYIEAYLVIAQGLQQWDVYETFNDKDFITFCLALGEELHWQGQIRRIESVSKPFLTNGIRLARNRQLIPSPEDRKQEEIKAFIDELDHLSEAILQLQRITLDKSKEEASNVPVERNIVPGSRTESITNEILEGEKGSHVGAFFDLDRTLIRDFSAKKFFQSHVLSGRMTSREVISQFAGVLVYATENKNFAGLAALSAKGVKGVDEQVFVEVGEEVYLNHLADTIIPESRALVNAHLAMGHTVAIVSAATPYQVNSVARDLGIEHVMCTRMEVENGKFTGNIIEPACWGAGKAYWGRELAKRHHLELHKSYFYTDSAEDLELLEIVGHPRPVNPDVKLSQLAFANGWPVFRFNEDKPNGMVNMMRTALAAGSMIPASLNGIWKGVSKLSRRDGVNSMMATFGDLGTSMAGISLAIKGEEYLENRPAVFIFNHQSAADMLIAAKLIRHDAVGIAKKELKHVPIMGQLMNAGGVIFLDRADREKAIEALKPATDALRSGTSVIIFPEGTRSKDYSLGKFKKGAFRMAMEAGVPLIPIVLKNAHDAMPKDSAVFRPTLVKVVVLPPVYTDGWVLEELDQKILEIRALFEEELGYV